MDLPGTRARMRELAFDLLRGHPAASPCPYSLTEMLQRSQELAQLTLAYVPAANEKGPAT
jgi:hypothetical protein